MYIRPLVGTNITALFMHRSVEKSTTKFYIRTTKWLNKNAQSRIVLCSVVCKKNFSAVVEDKKAR